LMRVATTQQCFEKNFSTKEIELKNHEEKNCRSPSQKRVDNIKIKMSTLLQADDDARLREILSVRITALEAKCKSIEMKGLYYKKKLMLLLNPFKDAIEFAGDNILIPEKAKSKKNPNDRCSIF
jgi:hypothetical protein